MGGLTTHILDTASGKPGAGIAITLYRRLGDSRELLGRYTSNADGRCDQPLISESALQIGTYELEFEVGPYFRQRGVELSEPAFLDTVVLRFGVADTGAHYHVPLLVSPYSYSTYRGS